MMNSESATTSDSAPKKDKCEDTVSGADENGEQLEENKESSETDKERPSEATGSNELWIEYPFNENPTLPEGWVRGVHESGKIIYTHGESNVCTLSMPYCIGQANIKTHPLNFESLPCFQYRNVISEEQKDHASVPHLQSVIIKQKKIHNYMRRLYKFKKVKIKKFDSWDSRKIYRKTRKREKLRNTLKSDKGKRLISFSIPSQDSEDRTIYMDAEGKRFVGVLHEYAFQKLKITPYYKFRELANSLSPYSATVFFDETEYATGYGVCKKDAKMEAAKLTLEILCPGMKETLNAHADISLTNKIDDDLSAIFDDVAISDPRVTKLVLQSSAERTPYEMLLSCVNRRADLASFQVEYKSNVDGTGVLTIGPYSVSVNSGAQMERKNIAAQEMLQKLYPHINTWGSLLRLLGQENDANMKTNEINSDDEGVLVEDWKPFPIDHELLATLKDRMSKLEEKYQ